jgi:hypothetical protein
VPIEDAPATKSGKRPTRVERLTTGTVPFATVARFPQGVRVYLGQEEWFQRDLLPFAHPYDGVHGDSTVVEDDSTITG